MTTPSSTPQSVNELHRNDDLDGSVISHHHTLGNRPSQAAFGDHVHDGKLGKSLSPTYVLYTTLQSFDALAAHLAGTETFTGIKTFSAATTFNGNIFLGAGLLLTAANAGIELGSTSVANTPFVDFHSSGFNNDYDARIIASGGANGLSGAGSLNVQATDLQLNGTSLPGGRLTSVYQYGTSAGFTVDTAIVSPAPSVTLKSGRRYRIKLMACIQSTTAGDVAQYKIRDGGASAPTSASTQIMLSSIALPVANYGFNHSTFIELVCVSGAPGNGQIQSGTHTFGMFASRASGGGTLSSVASASAPVGFIVEDIGT